MKPVTGTSASPIFATKSSSFPVTFSIYVLLAMGLGFTVIANYYEFDQTLAVDGEIAASTGNRVISAGRSALVEKLQAEDGQVIKEGEILGELKIPFVSHAETKKLLGVFRERFEELKKYASNEKGAAFPQWGQIESANPELQAMIEQAQQAWMSYQVADRRFKHLERQNKENSDAELALAGFAQTKLENFTVLRRTYQDAVEWYRTYQLIAPIRGSIEGVVVRAGQYVAKDHPIVAINPDLNDVEAQFQVSRATASKLHPGDHIRLFIQNTSGSDSELVGELLAIYSEPSRPANSSPNTEFRIVSKMHWSVVAGRSLASANSLSVGMKIRGLMPVRKVTIGSALYQAMFGARSRF